MGAAGVRGLLGTGPHVSASRPPFPEGAHSGASFDELLGCISETPTNALKGVQLTRTLSKQTVQGNRLTRLLFTDWFSPRCLVFRHLFFGELALTPLSFLFEGLFGSERRLVYDDFKNTPRYRLHQRLAEGGSAAERR